MPLPTESLLPTPTVTIPRCTIEKSDRSITRIREAVSRAYKNDPSRAKSMTVPDTVRVSINSPVRTSSAVIVRPFAA